MNIIVKKFGGSSVADVNRLKNVADIIIKDYEKGKGVVVVVSAQKGVTDNLIKKYKEIDENVDKREMDMILSSGEQISISLLTMMVQKMGKNAISYLGWQLPIITDSEFGDANIEYIYVDKIKEKLDEGYIVIVAGYQGIDENNNITTLGRGGSDTTAVALAKYLECDCEIYTDVDGVYDKDPMMFCSAKKYNFLSYEDMLEMSNNGAKVLHNKCVKYAMKNDVIIYVKSSFSNEKGTKIGRNRY